MLSLPAGSVAQGRTAAQIAASAEDAAARGKAWSLLGLARLHLVMPPRGGQDPARKPALKAAFLSGAATDIYQPELEVNAHTC